jgi:hypothetical protein
MLACYVSPEPDAIMGKIWSSPACVDAQRWLQDQQLIDADGRSTSKGDAWVSFICGVPLPEAEWVLPEDAVKQMNRDLDEPPRPNDNLKALLAKEPIWNAS